MKKNLQRNTDSGPDDSERTEDYWNDERQEDDLPWHARKTGRRKSKSKIKEENGQRRPTHDSRRDEFVDDSDLE